jgi:hypothetical protein
MIEMKYLVISNENNCVYTFTPRKNTAVALADGGGDAYALGVTYANMSKPSDFEMIKNRDVFYDKIYQFDTGKTNSFMIVDQKNVSQSWLDRRNLLRARQEAFFAWETMVENANLYTTKNVWNDFDVYMENELGKCDVKEKSFSWVIEEWARIFNTSVEESYKELKLQSESNRIKKFRVEAMAEKWKRKINAMTSPDEVTNLRKEMNKEFWLNSWI